MGSDSLHSVGRVYRSAAGDKVSHYYPLPEPPDSAPPVLSDDPKSLALWGTWYGKKDGYGRPPGKRLVRNNFLRQ